MFSVAAVGLVVMRGTLCVLCSAVPGGAIGRGGVRFVVVLHAVATW